MNIFLKFHSQVLKHGSKTALVRPYRKSKFQKINSYQFESISFNKLFQNSIIFACAFRNLGLVKGDRCLVFIRPSLDFSAVVFSLFSIGVIPVFIDPGMGRANLLDCISKSKAKALIGENSVHLLSKLFPKSFKNITVRVSITPMRFWPFKKMSNILNIKKNIPFDKINQEEILSICHQIQDEDEAAILFTSGGTGMPKGVNYTHGIFNTQTDTLQEMFHLNHDEIDMAGFPLFALFTLSMGMKSIIPDMDVRRPAKCNPEKLFQNIKDLKPTFIAGSPAIWERVANYCLKNNLQLESVKYVVMFGAPVSVLLHQKFMKILPNGTTYTPYGATEALPISNISGKEILSSTAELSQRGHGTCIGHPVLNTKVKVIKITDEAITHLSDIEECPPLVPGEIIVSGKQVTKKYDQLPDKTMLSKIQDANGNHWHRMGDMGYLDSEGRLWFLGRVGHRVETTPRNTLYPIACEAIFNLHKDVEKTALVGLGEKKHQTPAIVILRKDRRFLKNDERSQFESELLSLAKNFSHTKDISHFFYASHFPLDVRHNIKIDRLKLKEEIEKNA